MENISGLKKWLQAGIDKIENREKTARKARIWIDTCNGLVKVTYTGKGLKAKTSVYSANTSIINLSNKLYKKGYWVTVS
jgi:DNA-binding protein YbaB